MKTRPKIFIGYAILFVLLAISFPIQIALLYEHGIFEIGAILSKMTFLNWAVFWGFIVSAVLMVRVSPKGRFIVPFMLAAVLLNNLAVSLTGLNFDPLVPWLASLGFGALCLPLSFYQPALELMNNPEKRWWLRSERARVQAPVLVNPFKSSSFRTKTFDLSETGAFISFENNDAQGGEASFGLPVLQVSDRLNLCLNVGHISQLRFEAEVVRRSEANGSYPSGVGIRFTSLDWRDRKELRRYLRRQIQTS